VHIDPSKYEQIPDNPFGIQAGSILLPTEAEIVGSGGTSFDFVRDQGGDDDTFIFMFGLRPVFNLIGARVDILEGVFLTGGGPAFQPTWGFDQLLRETRLGGWKVVPTDEVLTSGWLDKVEHRMNIV
jgi:hypothetical protein